MTEYTLLGEDTDPVLELLTNTDPIRNAGRVPELGTCCYWEYTRRMGTAVRITRHPPRGLALPDPRFTEQPHWPSVRSLQPGVDYFKKGLPSVEFARRYVADLDLRERAAPGLIAQELTEVEAEHGRLVLLCFENRSQLARDPWCCHRRVFAAWWQKRTGREVPELTP